MFTAFVVSAIALFAEAALLDPSGTDAGLAEPSHPLMVLAEPSSFALAVIGIGLMTITHRFRRAKRRYANALPSSKTAPPEVVERPKRGAA